MNMDCMFNPNKQCFMRNLQLAYCGGASEMTAVNQYAFQETQVCGEVKEALKQISRVEMHHFHCLAEMINCLGGTPIYRSPQGWWTGQFVDYSTGNLNRMLQMNIAGERQAIKLYRTLIEQTEDCELKETFRKIIANEEQHIEIFKRLMDNCSC